MSFWDFIAIHWLHKKFFSNNKGVSHNSATTQHNNTGYSHADDDKILLDDPDDYSYRHHDYGHNSYSSYHDDPIYDDPDDF